MPFHEYLLWVRYVMTTGIRTWWDGVVIAY